MPDENGGNTVMASQLNNIRMKLEEKRRHIENEKRRMEVVMSKQRQKVGKAAFLQAVTKVKNTQDHYEHNSTMYNTLLTHLNVIIDSIISFYYSSRTHLIVMVRTRVVLFL